MKAVLIFSGGMDSTTLLYDLIHEGYEVSAITFDYRQKHHKEIRCAEKTCKKLQVPHKIIDVSVLNDLAPSSLTRAQWDVSEGNYAEETMKQTVVPNRNMVFLSLAASYAIGIGAKDLFYAAHAGDHAICKGDIVKKGLALNVDYVDTWSCYKGEDLPCGKCGACTERREAFGLAGVADPLEERE